MNGFAILFKNKMKNVFVKIYLKLYIPKMKSHYNKTIIIVLNLSMNNSNKKKVQSMIKQLKL